MDTTLFARTTDQEQWKNGFGMAFTGARGQNEDDGAFKIYDWAAGGLPPNNTANVLSRRCATPSPPFTSPVPS
jgi:hypothetical protein